MNLKEADTRGSYILTKALKPFSAKEPSLAHFLKSELSLVSDEAWTRFVLALKTAKPSSVSASNALGMFEMRPRRLGDLGILRNVRCSLSPNHRLVWIGDFVPPLTEKSFLASPEIQYKAFSESMRRYLMMLPILQEGMTLSGALAILHRCGPTGLDKWKTESERFPETISLYEKANGLF